MANLVCNIGRGKAGYYSGLPAANDAIIIVVLMVAEADDALRDYDDLAAMLASTPNEANSTNYARKSLASGVTFSVDDTANTAKSVVDADQTWTAVSLAAAEVWDTLVMCYDGDTTGGTDANIVPLTIHDFNVTPNGGDITANFDQTNGWWTSA